LRTLGIFPNLDKSEAASTTLELVDWLNAEGLRCVLPPEVAHELQRPELGLPVASWGEVAEFVVVLGGDGTLLHAARLMARQGLPMLGVNLGHLGFLTEVELPDLKTFLPRFLAGEYLVEERMMLQGRLCRAGSTATTFVALNEIAVCKGPFARLIHIHLWIEDTYVDTYPGDGVIVSTATGSTAYSLSAGGPILSPDVEAFVITPICAHTLYSRSLVVSGDNRVMLRLSASHRDTMLTVDGQRGLRLRSEDEIHVSRAPFAARLMRLPPWSFYRVLRRKLKDEGGNVRIQPDRGG